MKINFIQTAIISLLLLSMSTAVACKACDSSMLAILTGSSMQKEITTKNLAICQKIQQTGDYLNGFNIAAARKLHHEVMENWLQTATELTTTAAQNAGPDSGKISGLLMSVSRDLGKVRRQLDEDDMTLIHETLEATITRISLMSAMINGHEKMRKFLAIELAIFSLRPFFNDLTELRKLTGKNLLQKANAEFRLLPAVSETAELERLDALFADFCSRLSTDEKQLPASGLAAFQSLQNYFINFKQSLLNRKFFNQP